MPPSDEQDAIVATQMAMRRHASTTRDRRSSDQIDLLHERRQALITAAVTGQLDIPEAA